MTFVTALKDLDRHSLAVAGGKGANLGEAIRAGFPVPDIVVTTDAYALVAADPRVSAVLAETLSEIQAGMPGELTGEQPAGADPGARVRAAFEVAEVPEKIRRAILEAYAALGAGPVAVRSSATAEDLPGAAFAGQQDTYLNVVGERALIDAVRRCWASLWTARAIAYRARRGIGAGIETGIGADGEVGGVRIAVVVQAMAEAELAGVMFTANPVTGARDQIIVEASGGLGEAVVSGLVTPDHYVLDGHGRIVEHTPGRREVVIRPAPGGGVLKETPAAGAVGAAESLPERALARLAALGRAVEAHFGRPQDIEWAYAAGAVTLLQARPLTALPPPPLRLGRLRRKLGSILLEYVPVRPYPIDMSTWVPYGPAGLMAEVTRHFGLRGAFEGFLPEVDGVVERLVPPDPRPSFAMLATPYKLVRLARRHDPARWTADPRFAAFMASMARLQERDVAAMDWPELVRLPRQALHSLAPIAAFRIDYLPRTGLSLLRLALVLRLLGRGGLLAELITGARTRTADANRALEALAAMVRQDRRLGAALEEGALTFEHNDAFRTAFAAFLTEYGHRETTSPILVTPPTWGEAPEVVLGAIKVLAGPPPEPAGTADQPDQPDQADQAERALRSLLEHRLLRGRPRRAQRVRRWVEQARAGLAFREDSHFYFTKPLPVLRRALLEMGARLRDVGVLAASEEVFHLRLEELETIGDPARASAADRARLRELVRRRAQRRAELEGVPLIDPRAVFPVQDAGDALVAGTPAGGGRAGGPVRVIREPAEFGTLAGGEVLVCPYTNPSWTPLFQRAAAVVVDTGGPASHAAIVAREYGIPAVMGTAVGTSVLRTGQMVTVDGSTGRVTASEITS
ncbi:PEP/pyruvate-binding domain-containing protein [Nonomuraea africana]|uniref:PEP/pyruvate-binding domain-containing protein n=1 Tax=Nonomuraea africana TaxID=46171 RepID=UPI0033C1C01C